MGTKLGLRVESDDDDVIVAMGNRNVSTCDFFSLIVEDLGHERHSGHCVISQRLAGIYCIRNWND